MFESVVPGVVVEDALLSLSVVAMALLVAGLARFLLRRAMRLAEKTGTGLDNVLVSAVMKPLVGAILATGLYLAILFLPLVPQARSYVGLGYRIVISLLAIYAALAVVLAFLRWYRVEMASKTGTALDEKLARLLSLTSPVITAALAALVVLELLGYNLAPVKGWLGDHGARLGLIIALGVTAVFALDRALPRTLAQVLTLGVGETDAERQKRANTLTRTLTTTGQVVVLIVAGFMALSELGVNLGPVLAGLGVAGLAFGFGGQYVVRDLIAGVFVIMENQYRVGDVVRLADIGGLVEDINLRRTVLRDLDGIVHVIPNGEIRVASNFTRGFSRVNLNVSVSYDTDLDHAMAVINRVGKELAEDPQWAPLLLTPPQALRVDDLGDSGIEIKVLGDTQPIQQWAVTGELRKRIKKAFDQEGIEIPWPHTKVYFGNWGSGQK